MRVCERVHARERRAHTHTHTRSQNSTAHDPVPTSRQPAEMMNLCGRPLWWLITPCPAASAAHNSRCAWDWDATRPAPLRYRITSFFLNKRPGAQMREENACKRLLRPGAEHFLGRALGQVEGPPCRSRHDTTLTCVRVCRLDHTSLISIYAQQVFPRISQGSQPLHVSEHLHSTKYKNVWLNIILLILRNNNFIRISW